jgi:hypothetical protein
MKKKEVPEVVVLLADGFQIEVAVLPCPLQSKKKKAKANDAFQSVPRVQPAQRVELPHSHVPELSESVCAKQEDQEMVQKEAYLKGDELAEELSMLSLKKAILLLMMMQVLAARS